MSVGAVNLSSCPVGEKYPHPNIPNPNFFENFTYPKFLMPAPYPEWQVTLTILINVLAIIMAIVGNLLVIITVTLSKNMHNTTFYYIVNLAVSDLLMSLLMYVHLMMGISHEFPFNMAVCKIFPFLQILALTASTMFLTAIAVDRFFSIVYPLRSFIAAVRPWKHIVTITSIWILAILVALPMVWTRVLIEYNYKNYRRAWIDERWPRYYTTPGPNDTQCPSDMPGRRLYYSMSVILMYFTPVVVMVIAYSLISYKLKTRKIVGIPTEHVIDNRQKTRKRVVRMLMIVFAAFLVCWTPQELIVLYNAFNPANASEIAEELRYAAIYIAYFNSALNPIIYAGLNSKFRQGFNSIIKCKRWRKKKVGPSNGSNLAQMQNGSTRTQQNGAAQNGSVPTQNSSVQTQNGSLPTHNGSLLTQNGSLPTQNGSLPKQNESVPTQNGSVPTQNGSVPTQNGSVPTQNGSVPTQNGSVPKQNGSVPKQNGQVPTLNGKIPTQTNNNNSEVLLGAIIHRPDAPNENTLDNGSLSNLSTHHETIFIENGSLQHGSSSLQNGYIPPLNESSIISTISNGSVIV